ncbi:unnamed protein product [Pelagomonas calceolata]|uniref:Isopenicillin N synthase-like Fe(2+) 2OG dioxygenase domain-containing protein n=1 Tax=Pelagomonas calceolata TaxID=35677 RepID=A0A7S3ZK95_9STRA|nr:unnamed protein product [Pelagomonas calceolata]|mmetsp:Transcript_15168/g.43190  ORF Transcript_15168/g.43190 Transcript_15168/m.43190 type:complete len:447 (+) Transcript_15168:27-1367(+)
MPPRRKKSASGTTRRKKVKTEPKEDNSSLNISVRCGETGVALWFKLKKTTKFNKIMDAFASRRPFFSVPATPLARLPATELSSLGGAGGALAAALRARGAAVLKFKGLDFGRHPLLAEANAFFNSTTQPREHRLDDDSMSGSGYKSPETGRELYVHHRGSPGPFTKSAADDLFDELHAISLQVTRATALGLTGSGTAFDELLDTRSSRSAASSCLRFHKYSQDSMAKDPLRDARVLPGGGTSVPCAGADLVACPRHVDRGLVTLILPCSGGSRLEVMDPKNGYVEPVDLADDEVAVLCGHTLSVASCGAVCEAPHRVSWTSASGNERLATVFTLRAPPDGRFAAAHQKIIESGCPHDKAYDPGYGAHRIHSASSIKTFKGDEDVAFVMQKFSERNASIHSRRFEPVPARHLRFLYDGSRVHGDQTPASLDMESGEQLDCFEPMMGD